MSPVSRGRKNKKKKPPQPRDRLSLVLREYVPLVTEPDPLQVELFTSSLIGSWWIPGDGEPERSVGLALIDGAAKKQTPAALAFLRAMQALGVTEEQRAHAREGADRLTASVVEPPWARTLDQVTVVESWQRADVYGDTADLLIVFERAGKRHGLVVGLDLDDDSNIVEAFLVAEPDEELTDLREEAESSEGVFVFERISEPRARRLIEDGLAEAELFPMPGSLFADDRALVLARSRILPEPEPAVEPREYAEAEREAIVREFFAEVKTVNDDPITRECVRRIIEFGCDQDAGRPLRVGASKLDRFLDEWELDGDFDPDSEELMPEVLTEWARWAAGRNGLSQVAIEELLEDLDELFERRDTTSDDDFPFESYMDGVPPDASIEEVSDAVLRRAFAIPPHSATIQDEDFDRLDPSDPDERHLLIVGEHPDSDDVTTEEIVINQLWDNDPPEAWAAAKRMLDAGKDRNRIIQEIGTLVIENSCGERNDSGAYLKALRKLR